MAGYSTIYVIGDEGGFMGVDGVNPIKMLILVGDADRQWLEPHYFDKSFRPIGSLKKFVPAKPDDSDNLLDAVIAFCSQAFRECESYQNVENSLKGVESLDFDQLKNGVPDLWYRLREEARPIFGRMKAWRYDLMALNGE